MKFQIDSRPTKRRDLIIFLVVLLVLAYVFRDGLLFVIRDKGEFLVFDAEYDDYIIAHDKVRPLASIIQNECNQKRSCPKNPAGWTPKANSSASVAGDMLYQPIASKPVSDEEAARTYPAFKITYYYNPAWQLFAYGGVDARLTLERAKRGQ